MDPFPISHDLLGKSASAYEHLRRAASHGQLRPGRRLSATGLAAAFGISETPVREALVRLSAEGFLDWETGKGHFTKLVTLDEQLDLHEVLALHLDACVGRPAGPSSDLRAALSRMAPHALSAAGDPSEAGVSFAEAAGGLGLALAARHGNGLLRWLMSILLDRTWLIRRLDLAAPERAAATWRRTEHLVEALEAGDTPAALSILGQHFTERRARLPALVAAAHRLAAAATYP